VDGGGEEGASEEEATGRVAEEMKRLDYETAAKPRSSLETVFTVVVLSVAAVVLTIGIIRYIYFHGF
jgi:hypothetical protein